MAQIVTLSREEGLTFLTMDAGGRSTCIDQDLCEALLDSLSSISPNQGDRVVVLKSTGSVFSAGGDLFAIERLMSDPEQLLGPLIDLFHQAILALRSLPIPVIAQVHGAAAGAGFSVAMACDFVVAGRSSRFVAGYPRIGTSSDGGLSYQLARRLGATQAMKLFLVDEAIDANAALALGLVSRVADDESLERVVRGMAKELAGRPPQAVMELKSLIGAVADKGLASHLASEREAFVRCARTPDFQRLVHDFTSRQQRKPVH